MFDKQCINLLALFISQRPHSFRKLLIWMILDPDDFWSSGWLLFRMTTLPDEFWYKSVFQFRLSQYWYRCQYQSQFQSGYEQSLLNADPDEPSILIRIIFASTFTLLNLESLQLLTFVDYHWSSGDFHCPWCVLSLSWLLSFFNSYFIPFNVLFFFLISLASSTLC